jgi:hypothetical protein
MAKNYITLDSRVDTFKDRFNDLTNLVGDLATLTTTGDSDLVQAINEHSAELGAITASDMSTTASTVSTAIKEHALELGTITAGAMGTTASTVSTAIAELDAEADSDRTNFGANVKNLMLMDGTSKHVTVTANNSTNETVYLTFVDGAVDSQGIETDTGLTYNPSSGNLGIAGQLTAATLDISGAIDVDGTTNLDVVDIDGAVQVDATVTVGVNDTGYDVKFFGDAASAYMQWDASADDLILGGAAGLIVPDGQLTLGSTALTSTATELNLLDNVSGLVQADFTKLAAVTSSAAEINLLDGVSGLVQADFTKLAAVDATATELNIIDGGTSATSTTIVDADRVVVNDAGTMKQVAVTDLAAYFDDEITAMPNLVTVSALNSGSITSGFGSINVGSSSITTTGAISGGSVTVGSAALNETELEILDGATITTTELNVLDGNDTLTPASDAAITVADGDAVIMNDGGVMRQVDISLLKSYFGQVAGGTALTTIDIDGAAVIGEAIVDNDKFPISNTSASGGNRRAEASELRTYTNAGLLSRVDQTNITSLGTLSALQVDQLNLNAGELKSTSGNLSITPASGSTIILDGQINIDAGVVTGASSITSTAFVGNISGSSGSTTGNAATATTLATARTIGGVSFNGSANISLPGVNTAGNQATSGLAASATKLATTRAFSITGDVTASAVNFDGQSTVTLSTSLSNNAVVTNSITDDAVTYAKMQNLGTADRVLGSTSTGVIGEVQIVADMIATGAVVAAKIGADAITAAKIGDDVINSEHYAAGSIDREHLAADIIDGTKIADDVINSEHYAAGSIDREHLAADIIDGTKIADDVINSEHYVHGSIDALHIADDTITEAKMANDAIGQNELKTLRTFTLKDSAGSTLFTMYGAGA